MHTPLFIVISLSVSITSNPFHNRGPASFIAISLGVEKALNANDLRMIVIGTPNCKHIHKHPSSIGNLQCASVVFGSHLKTVEQCGVFKLVMLLRNYETYLDTCASY